MKKDAVVQGDFNSAAGQQLVISFELCNCNLRYKALETTFYVVIALLPSLAVYEMVRNNDFDYLKFLTSFFNPEILMS